MKTRKWNELLPEERRERNRAALEGQLAEWRARESAPITLTPAAFADVIGKEVARDFTIEDGQRITNRPDGDYVGVVFTDGSVLVVEAAEGMFGGSDVTPPDPPYVRLWVGAPVVG